MENTNTPAETGTAPQDAAQKRFRVILPAAKVKKGETPPPKYSGVHPIGITFRDGQGVTTDPIKAHAMLEFGAQVIDEATGKPAFGAGGEK